MQNTPQHKISLGKFKRSDDEIFDISGVLYESPTTIDYWTVSITAQHANWGLIRFVLTIPKKIAETIQLAAALARGPVFEQIKSSLNSANVDGRDLAPCFSLDGWVLI